MSDSVVYRANVHIERIRDPYRLAYLPAKDEPIAFGVHSEIAQYDGVKMDQHAPHAIATRVHAFHAKFCPVSRSINGSIEIITTLEMT
ncbi:MAG: hypothetical protein KDD78_01820 [Caldilineaceae bacterium]|nr:hypothetical protein [Caldilineaceae bacterium]